MKKVILITGASRGLGKATYDKLKLNKEYKVYGSSRFPKDNELLQLDIKSIESVTACISKIIDIEGHIDVLINNVGTNLIGSLEGTSMEEFQREIDVNLYGTIRMIQEVLPFFRKQSSGKIINISSLGGKVSLPYNSSYASSKAAIEAMSESLYYELKGSGISISIVAPIALAIEEEVPNIKYINNEKTWNKDSLNLLKTMKSSVKPNVSKAAVVNRIERIIGAPKVKFRYGVGLGSKVIAIIHEIIPLRLFSKLLKL